MRILLVTPFVPDPEARHGGGAFLGALAEALADRAEIGLAALRDPDERDEPGTNGSPFHWVATTPARSRPTGIRRIPHQLRMLWRWRRLPLVAAKWRSPRMPAVLDRAMAEFRPDVAFVEMAQMAQYLPCLAGVPTVFTDHEAGCPANTRTGLGAAGDRRDQRLWGRYVDHYYPRATALQALTPEDAAALSAKLGLSVAVRPPLYAVPAQPVAIGTAPARVLFLGDYSHGPNPEAARHLVERVLPRIRAACPDATLRLAGANPEAIADLAAHPGVEVTGFLPDLRGVLADARLLLAPLYSGAGFRVKCLAALAHGLPVVTNALGARGLDVPAPARTVVEDDGGLAEAAIRLLRSASAASAAGQQAHAWAQANVQPAAVAQGQVELAQRIRAQ